LRTRHRATEVRPPTPPQSAIRFHCCMTLRENGPFPSTEPSAPLPVDLPGLICRF
jgi:hypothetical protein